jgi:hypothetical protein
MEVATDGVSTTYASMLSTGQQAADFLRIFHPMLKASGLNTTIVCCDGGGWEEARNQLSGLQEAGVEDTLEIASAHGYFSPPKAAFNTTKRVCKFLYSIRNIIQIHQTWTTI